MWGKLGGGGGGHVVSQAAAYDCLGLINEQQHSLCCFLACFVVGGDPLSLQRLARLSISGQRMESMLPGNANLPVTLSTISSTNWPPIVSKPPNCQAKLFPAFILNARCDVPSMPHCRSDVHVLFLR